jgi:3-hydroxybutyrate dehydrogenase
MVFGDRKMLKGRTALVTGSTSGIGLGVASAFAAEGCNIALNGFGDAAEIEKIRSGLASEHKIKVAYYPADMSKPDDIAAMIRAVEAEFGGVDILVNNAGIQHVALIEEFPDDKWASIIAINLSSAFHTIKAAMPGMKRRKWGRIVNIASAHGLVASTGKVAYVAAKHGVVGLTKVVALEAANFGVTCNAICPGWVLTPLIERQIEDLAKRNQITIDEAKVELLREKQPLLKFTTPEQVANLAVYLGGDAAQTITGSAISIDGGWTAQ